MEVTFSSSNLYRNGEIVILSETERILTRDLINLEGEITDVYYIVKKEDRLDLIAYAHYKDSILNASNYWWVIADPNLIDNPLDISHLVGEEILIPNLANVLLSLQ